MDSRKVWNDQVWSKVIAGVILAALLGAVGWVMHLENWWPVVGHGITVAWAYLLGTTPVRRWVFGALVFIAGLFVLLVISVSASLYQPKKNMLRRYRATYLDEMNCKSTLRRFWNGWKPGKDMAETYSQMKKDLAARLREAERVGYGFTIPALRLVSPNAPKKSKKSVKGELVTA